MIEGVGWDIRSVEGALYGLGRPIESRPVTPTPQVARPSRPVLSQMPRQLVRRVDLHHTVLRRLTPDEVVVLREHYIIGVKRHGYAERRPIIGKLRDALNEP